MSFISFILNSYGEPLNAGYLRAFFETPIFYNNEEAMGLILMGGEL